MGDVISALPALWALDQALGNQYQAQIVVKTQLEASILNAVSWQGKVSLVTVPAGAKVGRLLRAGRIALQLRLFRADVLVTPHVLSARASRWIAACVGARLSVVTASSQSQQTEQAIFPNLGEHKAQFYARFFAAAGIEMPKERLQFPPLGAADVAPVVSAHADSEPRIILAPAVGAVAEQHKRWDINKFAALAERIVALWPAARLEITGAPPERPILNDLQQRLSPMAKSRSKVVAATTLDGAARGMQGAKCIVTGCSGASHIAAWAGISIVGIYGPTNPGFTGPFSQHLHVVRKGYACSPCYRSDFLGGCADAPCMGDISDDQVFFAVQRVMSGAPAAPVPILADTRATALQIGAGS
jgi:heptosyltransferase-2